MRNWFVKLDRTLKIWFPQAYYWLLQKPKTVFRFRKERQLVRGKKISQSDYSSILFFTTHKCASRYVSSIISSLALAEQMPSKDFDAYVTSTKVPIHKHPYKSEGSLSHAFQKIGYYYGPIGSYRNIPDRGKYRVLLQLRDPRDVLTSLYFSTAYSHAIINQKIISERKQALALSLDEYVLRSAQKYRSIYQEYVDKLYLRDDVLFLKYEDMVENFPSWLGKLSTHCGFDHLTETLSDITSEADFKVAKEDKFVKRRQVTPGEHARKLSEETVAELDSIFATVLSSLGYAAS